MKNNFFVKALLLLVLVLNNQYSHSGGFGGFGIGLAGGLLTGAALSSASRPRYYYRDRYYDRYYDEDPIVITRERRRHHRGHRR